MGFDTGVAPNKHQKWKMLKTATLLVLVGGLGLGVLCFISIFILKFKSLKCTVSLRSLYNWIAVDCQFVYCCLDAAQWLVME